jgi:hypothetical protein
MDWQANSPWGQCCCTQHGNSVCSVLEDGRQFCAYVVLGPGGRHRLGWNGHVGAMSRQMAFRDLGGGFTCVIMVPYMAKRIWHESWKDSLVTSKHRPCTDLFPLISCCLNYSCFLLSHQMTFRKIMRSCHFGMKESNIKHPFKRLNFGAV